MYIDRWQRRIAQDPFIWLARAGAAQGLLPNVAKTRASSAFTCFACLGTLKLTESLEDVSAGSRTLLRRAAKSPLDSWGGSTLVFCAVVVFVLLILLPQQKIRAKLSSRALALHTSAPGKVTASA